MVVGRMLPIRVGLDYSVRMSPADRDEPIGRHGANASKAGRPD